MGSARLVEDALAWAEETDLAEIFGTRRKYAEEPGRRRRPKGASPIHGYFHGRDLWLQHQPTHHNTSIEPPGAVRNWQ